jgi:tetratricopeptide (TPR) repeat protein
MSGLASSVLMSSFPIGAAEQVSIDSRYERPSKDSDEGSLWGYMDHEEDKLKKSPFLIRDSQFKNYLSSIACKLGGAHCPDIRVYPLMVPFFNANMAPNGMMQIWSGLMLRVDNEAQLAGVLGHEIGHYLARHSIQHLRDAKSRSGLGFVTGLFGAVGAIASLGLAAGGFAYSRENETAADEIGISLLSKAGYDPNEFANVWENLQIEIKASTEGENSGFQQLFSTHPLPKDRQDNLRRIALLSPGSVKNEELWQDNISPYLRIWLKDEVKRNKFESSLALFNRLVQREKNKSEYLFSRGEVYRLRNKGDDFQFAINDYKAAVLAGNEPAEVHKGLGLIYKSKGDKDLAKASFLTFLAKEPQASDSLLIKSYIEELES